MLVRLLAAAVIVASHGCATIKPCQLEQNCGCPVPGITLRWKAAYCMAVEQTDDLEQAGVQRCVQAPDPPRLSALAACEQNRHWKTMLCRTDRPKADADRCIRDETFVPAIVAHGPG